MGITIQGNKPLRYFAAAMFSLTLAAHFLGQLNLLESWVFWIVLLMSANAFQATFTGFCPMVKNAKGECLGCGTSCRSSNQLSQNVSTECGANNELEQKNSETGR